MSRPGRERSRRILIVGGGFVGMVVARRLERRIDRRHAIELVTPENFMLYHPFLPEVASGTIDPRAVVVPLRRALRRTRLTIGEVERVEHDRRSASVRLPHGAVVERAYDEIVLAPGSRSRVSHVPGLAEHGIGFKTLAEAIWLRNRVLSQLDRAEAMDDPRARRQALTFVFVGGGYAGIEALGELEDLVRDALPLYRTVAPQEPRWLMVEAGPRILRELDEDLAADARRRLEERGVEFRIGTRLEAVEPGRVRLSDGEVIAADTVVWTTGVHPVALARRSGLPVDATGRLLVDPYLRVQGLEGAWGAGDAAAVPDVTTGGLVPATAQHALREARRLADNLASTVDGDGGLRPFRWKHKGSVVSLGHYEGVANPLGIRVRGFPAWFLHRTYHLFAMPTLGRRVRIAADWTVALLFARDVSQLGSLTTPREAFLRALESDDNGPHGAGGSEADGDAPRSDRPGG
ncbi:MAG: NADH dehydrogenase [Actinomycetota bacterium]|jgi:NADH dehydrogenase|nr:MAG: NADH dehydrogenase [Actinomycetota bacterium]